MNIGQAAEILARHQTEGRLRPEDPMLMVTVLVSPAMVNEMVRRAGVRLEPPTIDSGGFVEAFLGGRAVP